MTEPSKQQAQENMARRLTLTLFGGLSVQRGAQPPIQLPPQQTATLLAYLALRRGRSVPRQELAAILWPESEPEKAFANLRQCIRSLHLLLKESPSDPDPILQATRAEISLNLALTGTDVAEFECGLDAAKCAESPSDRIAHLTRAVQLYRGELLPGFYLDFFTWERSRLAERHVQCLHTLVHELDGQGESELALHYARSAAQVDPHSEATCIALMSAYAGMGQPSAVLRQYQEWEPRYLAEFGESPSNSVRETADHLHRLAKQRAGASAILGAKSLSPLPAPRTGGAGAPIDSEAPLDDRRGVETFATTSHPIRRKAIATLIAIGATFMFGLFVWAARPGSRATVSAGSTLSKPGSTASSIMNQPVKEAGIGRTGPAPGDSHSVTLEKIKNSAAISRELHLPDSKSPAKRAAMGTSGQPHPIHGPDGAGEELWSVSYHLHSGDKGDEPTAMTTDRAGNIYITGLVVTIASDVDYLTLKYSPDGHLLWEQRYNGPANDMDRAKSIAVDDAGNVYVTGESHGGKGHGQHHLPELDIATIKYRADGTPSPTWPDVGFGVGVRRYAGTAEGRDSGWKVGLDGKGNVYVAGRSWGGDPKKGGTGADLLLLKYGPDGKMLGEHRYPGGMTDPGAPVSMVVDTTGAVYVAGSTQPPDAFANITTLRCSASGDLTWSQPYAGQAGANMDSPRSVALGRGNDLYVCGFVNMGINDDKTPRDGYLILKYNPSGKLAWDKTYKWYSMVNRPASLVVDSGNNVYVTGTVGMPGHSGFGTLRLDKDGELIWAKPFNGTGRKVNNGARGQALDSAGNVYVTGLADFMSPLKPHVLEESTIEYATVLYDPASGERHRLLRHHGQMKRGGFGAFGIAVDNDDQVVVTGQMITGNTADIVTVKYRACVYVSP